MQPVAKSRHVRKLCADGKIVATAGDGGNDAPALSHATMGNTRENRVFACACDAIGIPVAAGVL